MLSILPLSVIALLIYDISATPTPPPNGFSMPIRRRVRSRSFEDFGVLAKSHRAGITAKYGSPSTSSGKRSTGTNLITDQGIDSSYFGSLAIGTPAVSYDVILDTGSADLWVAGNACSQGCESVLTFDPSHSSSFSNDSRRFSINYGSGSAEGYLATDIVQMAGFSVSNQVFAVCNTVTGILTSPVSGLIGLAWEGIASSGAVPLWQTLASSGAWDSPVMAFQLTRFLNQTEAQDLEFGGSFTMGFVNSSLYSGDIEYIDMPTSTNSYWILPITAITVQGNSIAVGAGTDSYAAIDTGTTNVGGPPDQIASIYEQIPDSEAGTGKYEGYYLYPCATAVTVTLSFGGRTWSISPSDFKFEEAERGACVGAFFPLTTGDSAPPWIVGDTFLKNVYSVFRYNPPSVGFADLSAYSLSLNGDDSLPVPSGTIGSVSAEATARSSDRNESNGAKRMKAGPIALTMAVSVVLLSSF